MQLCSSMKNCYDFENSKYINILICKQLINKYTFKWYNSNTINILNNNFYKNIVIVPSKILTSINKFSYTKNRSIYNNKTRYKQTLQTLLTVRKYIKNCYIIILDNSDLNDKWKTTIQLLSDKFIAREEINNITIMDNYTDIQIYKEKAESYQLKYMIDYIMKTNRLYYEYALNFYSLTYINMYII